MNMYCKRALLTLLLGCLFVTIFAQDRTKIKFGKIDKSEFALGRFEKDTGAHAIVLSAIGSSTFESDGAELRLVYKVHRRIKIVDKNGYDLATVKVWLYKDGSEEEKLSNVKAAAYNLENGEIVETKIDSKSIFTDKQSKNIVTKKFAIPAVKEGTIIEYTYTISSPYYQYLRSWEFQGEYPALWSEYTVTIPEYFDYVFINQGYEKFVIQTKESSIGHFTLRGEKEAAYGKTSEIFSVSPGITTYKWALKDVPPIRDESFITTTDNYTRKIEFQLSAYNWPGQPSKPVRTTWAKLMEDLQKSESFGKQLTNNNNFLSDKVSELTKDTKSDKEKAEKIYVWVRDNYTCTDHTALWCEGDRTLKTLFNSKSGNVAEINLLLIAMLKKAGLEAYPVILSTRDNGYVYPYYPLLSRFNYTIAAVMTDGELTRLDASRPLLGFGRLPASCYNGDARVVDEQGTVMPLATDSLKEQKFTSVFISKIADGNIEGSFQQRPTYFESYRIRQEIKEKSQDEYFKKIVKGYTSEISLSEKEIEGLTDLGNPLMVKYSFKLNAGNSDVLYINPLFGEAYKHNPFKSMERSFPVEMEAVYDEVYSLNLEIPEGYVVDEMPKPAIAKYNEEEGLFQYLIQQQQDHIQLRCRVKLTKANFQPEEYASLREFFDLIVKKQAEQIVLKKKSKA
ncbi:MAG TPA: transglutaminase domain-containing protein [Chitinophaga sp.]|uniref:DUF3857 domain-containing protein n=1 Tax=Chitinophaga sp. TaxID=1869181 RepID=UPI002C1FF29F|nr:transglutaminase domain-containing protein [Chitinophaga sp.]HVI48384.1 transglutaminase domain-containing protein [Chitinophaga sp.]